MTKREKLSSPEDASEETPEQTEASEQLRRMANETESIPLPETGASTKTEASPEDQMEAARAEIEKDFAKGETVPEEAEEAPEEDEIPAADRILRGETQTIGEMLEEADSIDGDDKDRGSIEERAKKYLRFRELDKELRALNGEERALQNQIGNNELSKEDELKLQEIWKKRKPLSREFDKLRGEIFSPAKTLAEQGWSLQGEAKKVLAEQGRGLWGKVKKLFGGGGKEEK